MGSCNGNGTVGLIEAPHSGHAGLVVIRGKQIQLGSTETALFCEKRSSIGADIRHIAAYLIAIKQREEVMSLTETLMVTF